MKKLNSILYLHDLTLKVHLGWTEAERRLKQSVSVDIQIQFKNPPKACMTDELTDTICYDTLTKKIKDFIQKKSFRLIEYLAREIYLLVKENTHAANILVTLSKKPPVKNLKLAQFYYGDQ